MKLGALGVLAVQILDLSLLGWRELIGVGLIDQQSKFHGAFTCSITCAQAQSTRLPTPLSAVFSKFAACAPSVTSSQNPTRLFDVSSLMLGVQGASGFPAAGWTWRGRRIGSAVCLDFSLGCETKYREPIWISELLFFFWNYELVFENLAWQDFPFFVG